MSNKIQKYFASALFGLAAFLLLAVRPAQASTPVTACGQTLSAPGEYILATNLDCSGTMANGVNIAASNVAFHLAGHTISSTDCDSTKGITGISTLGGLTKVRIDGGTVKGFNDGIALVSSNSRVAGVIVTNACIFGIAVQGANNQVDTSVVTLSGLDGIGLQVATNTHIVSNDISGNVRLGVDLANNSNNNFITNNIINDNGIVAGEQGGVAIFFGTNNLIANNALNNNFEGIELESPGNIARGNTVSGSHTGIFVTSFGAPSTVIHNTVLGSSTADMSDDVAGCGGDVWKGNDFQTDLVAGVSDGGPKAGCIR
jgi:parallel beta-helix repeat protein